VSKVDLRLQCGMPCSKLEVSTVQYGTLSRADYLHESRARKPRNLQQHAMARSIAVVIARRPALAFSASGKSHIPSEVNLVRRYSV
jgi:hypothetical protein